MKVNDILWQNEVTFYPYNYYGSIEMPSFDAARFSCPKKLKKYNKCLGTDYKIFCKPYIKIYIYLNS